MRVERIREKIFCVILITILAVATVGVVSVSAARVTVDDSPNYHVVGGYSYGSQTINCSTTATVVSQPTFGTVRADGGYELDLCKVILGFGSRVLSLSLNMHTTMAGTSVSYNLGKTSGNDLSFGVGATSGSNADFYVARFHGEMRY